MLEPRMGTAPDRPPLDSEPRPRTAVHGGDVRRLAARAGRSIDDLLDFSASINPLGPPAWVPEIINSSLPLIAHYPDPDCTAFRAAAARRFGVDLSEIIAGNGSAELLHVLPRALRATRAVIPVPSYSDYLMAAEAAALVVRTVPMVPDRGFALDLKLLESALQGDEIVLLGQPNNPTGQMVDRDDLRGLILRWPRTTFIVDEAFADFVPGYHSLTRRRPSNLVVLRSLTKFYAIPGLRLGLAFAEPPIIGAMRRALQPWPVNVLAQAVGEVACEGELNGQSDYAIGTCRLVAEERARMVENLRAVAGIHVFPGRANFLLARVDRPSLDAAELARRMLRQGVAIRVCDSFQGLDRRYFRVAVRTAEENASLCHALRRACEEASAPERKT